MKEKIGIEKLIELLNKHRIELAHGNLQNQLMRHYNGYVFGLGDLNSQNCVLLIISKEYGFIKWLVENDKIKPLRKFIGWETDEDEPYIQFDLVDQYIAYLSISDTPIEDLISYLK